MVFHRHGWRIGAAAGLVVVGLVCVATAWATLLTPEPVVTAKGRQIHPSAALGGAYLAYSQSRPGHFYAFDVYVKPAGMRRFKVNTRGQGFAGGIDGTTLIWQRVRNGQSDLRLFDLASHTRSVPAGVNTRRYEYWPTISGDWILYGQSWRRFLNSRVILHDTNTSETRILDERVNRSANTGRPGAGERRLCHLGNHQRPHERLRTCFCIRSRPRQRRRLPRPTGKAAVLPIRHARRHGLLRTQRTRLWSHVVLREYAAGVDTPLAVLPRGYNVFSNTFAVDEGGGVTSVYFDRVQCSTGKSHIYKITVS